MGRGVLLGDGTSGCGGGASCFSMCAVFYDLLCVSTTTDHVWSATVEWLRSGLEGSLWLAVSSSCKKILKFTGSAFRRATGRRAVPQNV